MPGALTVTKNVALDPWKTVKDEGIAEMLKLAADVAVAVAKALGVAVAVAAATVEVKVGAAVADA